MFLHKKPCNHSFLVRWFSSAILVALHNVQEENVNEKEKIFTKIRSLLSFKTGTANICTIFNKFVRQNDDNQKQTVDYINLWIKVSSNNNQQQQQ